MELHGAGGYVGASALRSRFLHSSGLAGLIAVGVVAAVPVGQAQEGLPTGGIVTFGQAAISRPSTTGLLVTQTTPTAIIDWQSFSVGGGATAHFDNGAGATLNRVRSNDPSLIQGSLTATGSLYLVNPAGVAVGPSGRVSTGGSFIASTHDCPASALMGPNWLN